MRILVVEDEPGVRASLLAFIRELVELELIPRQRRHVEALSAMHSHLAA